MDLPKTNATTFTPNLRGIRSAEWSVRIKSYVRRLKRHLLSRELDDYDWSTYHQFYGPENEVESRNWTYDLGEVDYRVIDGRIFIISDSKPLHYNHRALFEAVLNLPNVASVHEIGTGGGKFIVNIGRLFGPSVRLGASDIGHGQLKLFQSRCPGEYRSIEPFVHDITASELSTPARADVVFTATVLMHIKRREAYRSALSNLLASANGYVVLIEYWPSHNYVEDIRQIAQERLPNASLRLYAYDSGAAVVLVTSLRDEPLPDCFQPLDHDGQLRKYG